MTQACIQIVIEFRHDLLGHFTVPQWNSFVSDLLSRGLTPPIITPGQKPDKELAMGDLILTNKGTIAEVEATEAFGNSAKRPCVEVSLLQCGRKSTVVFLAEESVLVIE